MKKRSLLTYINGFEKDTELRDGGSFLSFRFRGSSEKYTRFLMKNPLVRFLNRVGHRFAYTSTRSYGLMLLFGGLSSVLLHFIGISFGMSSLDDLATPIVSAVIAALGILLSIPDTPICIAARNFAPTDYLLFEFFCMKRMHDNEGEPSFHPTVTSVFGVGLALLAFFFPAQLVLAAVGALIFLVFSFLSPEFTLIFSFLSFPYLQFFSHTTALLLFLVGVCLFSYVNKVLLGKRLFHFEKYDALLALFLLFLLISGIFNGGASSFYNAAAFALLALGYLLTGNLITNHRLANRVLHAMTLSSVPVAIFAVFEYALGLSRYDWLDEHFNGLIAGRVTASFNNPNTFAVYLLVAIFFSLGLAKEKLHTWQAAVYGIIAVLNTVALVFTWSRGAWFALLLSVLAYAVISLRKLPGYLLILFGALPYLLFFLPDAVLERLLSALTFNDSSVVYRVSIWRSSMRMFLHRFFTGVGVGPESFSAAFGEYAESGVVAEHSHNLFLEIGCEAGIFALLAFLGLLLLRVRHHVVYTRYAASSSVSVIIRTVAVTLFALVVFGMTDYPFSNLSICYLFFALFGIGSSTLRVAKREYDETLCYFDEDTSGDVAAVDVRL